MAPVWDAMLERLRRGESEQPRGVEALDLEALLPIRRPGTRHRPTVRALRCCWNTADPPPVPLAADAFPNLMDCPLLKPAQKRGVLPPLALELLTLSHNGSRCNLI